MELTVGSPDRIRRSPYPGKNKPWKKKQKPPKPSKKINKWTNHLKNLPIPPIVPDQKPDNNPPSDFNGIIW